MNLTIKGFIIGIGKIIPGVSGAMLAITLGEYDKIINSIAHMRDNLIKNMKYLSKIGVGIILSIILTSKLIVKCLDNYYFITILLFTGIIIGGIPEIAKTIKIKRKDIIISILCITGILIITNITPTPTTNVINYNIIDFTKLIGIGIIDAISSIVPGISGTAILISLGYYNHILETFATIPDLSLITRNLFILIPFIIGFIIGSILISKIINLALKKIPNIINILVTFLMSYTTSILLKNTLMKETNTLEIIIGIILFIISLTTTIRISNKKENKKYI